MSGGDTSRIAARLAVAWRLGLSAAPAVAVTRSLQAHGLAFGAYNPLSLTPVDSASGVTVTRTGMPGTSVVYALRLGPGGSGSFSERRMRSASRVHPVHGRLLARQNVPPGTYVDTLVLTVDF